MSQIKSNIFFESVLENIPRLLGQLDRNVLSRTYGSFDRAFWHYHSSDMNSSRFQEAILTLSLLWSTDFEGNRYFADQLLLDWINAAFAFTHTIQRADGSFDEWYPHEGSFVSTAFVTAALSESLLILGATKINNFRSHVAMLARSADLLSGREELLVQNQFAGALLAMYNLGVLTGDKKYEMLFESMLTRFLSLQRSEGWWNEYGGPDIGYLSLTIDYLVKCYLKTNRPEIRESIKKASAFIINFLHPDLTVGGEYASRNTEYLIPSGFVMFARFDQNALVISSFMQEALVCKLGISPEKLDDRYLCYILYNWLYAGISFSEIKNMPDIFSYFQFRRIDIFFSSSGIRIVQNSTYYFIINLYKGGSFRLYAKGKVYFDSGIGVVYNGQKLISGVLDQKNHITSMPEYVSSEGLLHSIREYVFSSASFILSRLFGFTFGRIPLLQRLLKQYARKKLIVGHDVSSVPFRRKITLCADGIDVEDRIGSNLSREKIYCGVKASYIFIPSSHYFLGRELNSNLLDVTESYSKVEGMTVIKRQFHIK